jgi:hypothetical protein
MVYLMTIFICLRKSALKATCVLTDFGILHGSISMLSREWLHFFSNDGSQMMHSVFRDLCYHLDAICTISLCCIIKWLSLLCLAAAENVAANVKALLDSVQAPAGQPGTVDKLKLIILICFIGYNQSLWYSVMINK